MTVINMWLRQLIVRTSNARAYFITLRLYRRPEHFELIINLLYNNRNNQWREDNEAGVVKVRVYKLSSTRSEFITTS